MRLWMKMIVVFGMTLAILVPLAMVRGVVHERQQYRQQVVRDVAASHGGAQSFAGPVLVVPYRQVVQVEETDAQGVVRTATRVREDAWTFFPTTLAVDGDLKPDVRRRNLHQVRVYEWTGSARAQFEVDIPADPGPAAARHVGEPYLSYAIGDVRGLGAMMALELVKDPVLKTPDKERTGRVLAEALKRGLILLSAGTYGNVVRVLVPLTIDDAVLEEGLAVMEQALGAA